MLNSTPKSRVNITLDVKTNDSLRRKELPLKLLVLANLSHKRSNQKLAERPRLRINANNFDQVIQRVAPTLKLSLKNTLQPNTQDLAINLELQSLADLHPDNLIQQIPELRKLLAMRHLLKDLKANMLDKREFATQLKSIMEDRVQSEQLHQYFLSSKN